MSHWLWAELDSVSVDPAIGISTSDGFFSLHGLSMRCLDSLML